MTDEVFRTERLRAVRWRDDHAPTAYGAYGQADFVRYLGNPTPHPDLDHTRRWVARINEVQGESAAGFWAVERLQDGVLVGATLCQPLPGGDGAHEIGWHVFPGNQRQGYATEIGRGAAAYGFDVLDLNEVYAVVMPDNAASLGVARALGMRPLGQTDRFYDVVAELFVLARST